MATNPFFNTEYYYQNNRDVFVSGMAAETHYMEYGAAEALEGAAGRKPAPWFDIVFYFENNPDLVAAKLTAPELFHHFSTYGFKEGRAPNAAAAENVNPDSLLAYALANPDLLAAFGIADDATELTDTQINDLTFQYFAYGYQEDRPALPSSEIIPEPEDVNYKLTVGQDNILDVGSNETVYAPVEQNFLGAVTNTLETGDVIEGAEGAVGVTLQADLAFSTSGTLPILAPAISATTKNVDNVVLRGQTGLTDAAFAAQGNLSHIDAENFSGVKEWWSDNSRATLQIEDVRTAPEDTLIGLRNSDPFVGFRVFFDPEQLTGETIASNSSLTLTLVDNTDPTSLAGVPVDGFAFKLGEESYSLQSDAIGEATTYAELEAAIQAALADTAGLEGVTATLNADNTITLNDPAGEAFTAGSWSFINNEVPPVGTISWDQVVGTPQQDDKVIETDLVLDNVGRTSQGGTVDIGSLGDGGVEEFNVQVGATSWVSSLESNSYLGNFYGDAFLEVVNVDHYGDATGNLTIGDAVLSTDDRVEDGLTNVRELNAADFNSNVKAGITLDSDSITRYLDDAEEPVEFNYTTGAGADNLTINVNGALSTDPDFALNVDLGANDDRLNLDLNGGRSDQITVDGGEGYNTIELNDSQGTAASNTFAEFANFQKYVVAGNANTAHVFGDDSGVNGVEEVVIATGDRSGNPGGNTTLTNLEADTSLTISGKNQTLGNSSNNPQNFGNINVNNAAAAALTVNLENTARLDGSLMVNQLNIDSAATALADTTTRTLDLVSGGRRDTDNTINTINAKYVNTFNITGTQDLTTSIAAAANSTGAVADRGDFVVDASELDANIDLTLSAAVVTAIDGTVNRTNTFTGAEGSGDVLAFDGAGVQPLVTTDSTVISGFETIQFDAIAGGSFNANKVSDVDLYQINSTTNANFRLINLANDANVQIDTDNVLLGVSGAAVPPAPAVAPTETTLALRGNGAQDAVNVTLDGQGATWLAGVNSFEIGGYKTINLNLDSTTTQTAYNFDLNLLDRNGLKLGEIGFVETGDNGSNWASQGVAARELVLTGGNASANNGLTSDSIELNGLDAALDVIDISGYAGQVTGSMSDFYDDHTTSHPVSDVKVVVGAWNMEWTVNNNGATTAAPTPEHKYNTTFTFTEAQSTTTNASEWTINNFVDATNGTVDNHTILDVSGLGISAYNQLDVVFDGTDTVITSQAQQLANNVTWEIKLAGGNYTADLGIAENFIFAS